MSKYLPYVIITLLTLLTWYKLLWQVPLGEGYYYFDIQQNFSLKDVGQTDNFAKIAFDILPFVFRDNLVLYMAFQLIFMVLLNLVFYYFVKVLTKNPFVSLTATILFAVSYIASFEMLGTGNYQRFLQRIPCLIPTLLSFIFLEKYLQTQKIKNFIISIFLFALGLFLGHFSTFLTFLFVIYPFFRLSVFKKIKSFFSSTFISTAYLLTNYFMISADHLKPEKGILDFINQIGINVIFEKIILQITNMLVPTFVIEKIAAISNPYTSTLIALTLPLIALIILGVFLVKKRAYPLTKIYLLSITIIPILLFLNLYLGKVDPGFNMQGYKYYFLPQFFINMEDPLTVKGDRYYMVPYFFISIIVSILLWSLVNKKSAKYVAIVFLSLYSFYNINNIWKSFDYLQPVSSITRNYINYTKFISYKFNKDTYIVTNRPLLWPSSFIRLFYGDPNMQFILLEKDLEYAKDKHIARENLFLFDYDYKNNKVLDLTAQYRNQGKI